MEATVIAFANRSLASLKLGDAVSAEEDCTSAIALDSTYLKAWQRRAAARTALGRVLDAVDDLECALRCAIYAAQDESCACRLNGSLLKPLLSTLLCRL
jgi:Tfp pilus assembly protein PilF